MTDPLSPQAGLLPRLALAASLAALAWAGKAAAASGETIEVRPAQG